MMRGWVLLLVGVLLAVPAALAAEGTLTGRAGLPIEVTGTYEATGEDSRFLLEGTAGQVSFLLHGAEGTATRVIHRAFGYVVPTDPKAEILWDDAVETRPLELSNSLLSLDARRDEFRLLALDGARLSSGADGSPLLVGALEQAKTVDYALERAFSLRLNPPSQEDRFSHVLPAGTFQARADDGRVQVDGPFQLFITDAVLTYRGPSSALEQVPAHFRIETRPGSLYDPLSKTWFGPHEHTEYIQEYLLVEATSGHLDLQFAGTQGSLYSPRPVLDVDGTALLPAMEGSVTIVQDDQPTRHALAGEDLELAGRFSLHLRNALANPASTQVQGSGDITAVTYAGTRATYDWVPVATAAGLGALALAALAWLGANAKTVGGLGGGLLAGYARVQGQEVLEHPGRQEVYERVKAAPGVNFVQLSEQVAFGSSTLNYHLRVLEKNGYVVSVKDGRYLRFFDRQAGTYSGAKKVAVSALRNATSAAMARHIRDHPGVAQCDLAAAFGVTASTVNWHMTRLGAAGLVERQRDAHYTRYYLSQGWSQLPTSEMERLGHAAPAPVPLLVAPLAV